LEERSPFTHILVPTDGSEPSIAAARLALQIAATHHTPLLFVYVVDDLVAERMAGATGRRVEAIYQELEEKGRSYVEYLERLAMGRGLQADHTILRGIPHREIASLARRRGIDLIVIGQAGSHRPQRLDIGSVSRQVVESAPCPVLVVRQATPRRW
jgi:nucleotide-binding universal stress UspA family protein